MRGHEYQKHDIPKMFLLSDDTLPCIKNNKQAKNVHRCVHVLCVGHVLVCVISPDSVVNPPQIFIQKTQKQTSDEDTDRPAIANEEMKD